MIEGWRKQNVASDLRQIRWFCCFLLSINDLSSGRQSRPSTTPWPRRASPPPPPRRREGGPGPCSDPATPEVAPTLLGLESLQLLSDTTSSLEPLAQSLQLNLLTRGEMECTDNLLRSVRRSILPSSEMHSSLSNRKTYFQNMRGSNRNCFLKFWIFLNFEISFQLNETVISSGWLAEL